MYYNPLTVAVMLTTTCSSHARCTVVDAVGPIATFACCAMLCCAVVALCSGSQNSAWCACVAYSLHPYYLHAEVTLSSTATDCPLGWVTGP